MDAVGYREALEPVLRHARVVRLIDPFLRPSGQYAPTIEVVAELLGKRGETERPGRIEIHTRELAGYPDAARCLDEWIMQARRWPCIASRRHRLDVFIWGPAGKRGDRRFHNRYIVTDQCAVAVNDALACLGEGRTNWDLLDADERRVVLRDFDEHVHPQSLLGRRRLAG